MCSRVSTLVARPLLPGVSCFDRSAHAKSDRTSLDSVWFSGRINSREKLTTGAKVKTNNEGRYRKKTHTKSVELHGTTGTAGVSVVGTGRIDTRFEIALSV